MDNDRRALTWAPSGQAVYGAATATGVSQGVGQGTSGGPTYHPTYPTQGVPSFQQPFPQGLIHRPDGGPPPASNTEQTLHFQLPPVQGNPVGPSLTIRVSGGLNQQGAYPYIFAVTSQPAHLQGQAQTQPNPAADIPATRNYVATADGGVYHITSPQQQQRQQYWETAPASGYGSCAQSQNIAVGCDARVHGQTQTRQMESRDVAVGHDANIHDPTETRQVERRSRFLVPPSSNWGNNKQRQQRAAKNISGQPPQPPMINSFKVPEKWNCSILLTGVPHGTTIHELLENIKDCGRIYKSDVFWHKNRRDHGHNENGTKSQASEESTCARIVFFTCGGAVTFYKRFGEGGEGGARYPIGNSGAQAILAWDSCRSAGIMERNRPLAAWCSRVLRVRGPSHVLRNYRDIMTPLAGRVRYRLDGAPVQVDPLPPASASHKRSKRGTKKAGRDKKSASQSGPGPEFGLEKEGREEKLRADEGDENNKQGQKADSMVEFEVRFASFAGQAEEAFHLIHQALGPKGVTVYYGRDPCA